MIQHDREIVGPKRIQVNSSVNRLSHI